MSKPNEIFLQVLFLVPQRPNFIQRPKSGGERQSSVSIADLSDADLERIGKAWTEKLIEDAHERRKT